MKCEHLVEGKFVSSGGLILDTSVGDDLSNLIYVETPALPNLSFNDLITLWCRSRYEVWEDAQLNSAGNGKLVAALSAKYGGVQFYDEDVAQQGFAGE